MNYKFINLTLPPFAFLDDPDLQGRNVILHIRSASVVEILENNPGLRLNPDAISKEFTYTSILGGEERMVAVLHHAPLINDREEIIREVIDPAIEYYIKDCEQLDSQAMNDIYTPMN